MLLGIILSVAFGEHVDMSEESIYVSEFTESVDESLWSFGVFISILGSFFFSMSFI